MKIRCYSWSRKWQTSSHVSLPEGIQSWAFSWVLALSKFITVAASHNKFEESAVFPQTSYQQGLMAQNFQWRLWIWRTFVIIATQTDNTSIFTKNNFVRLRNLRTGSLERSHITRRYSTFNSWPFDPLRGHQQLFEFGSIELTIQKRATRIDPDTKKPTSRYKTC